jgi:hypothetical protein
MSTETHSIISTQSGIPGIDFSTFWNNSLETYPASDPPDLVTRDNFTSFFIRTFALSHGIPELHLLVFYWFSARTGQDILGIIRAFFNAIEADGKKLNNALSENERTTILNSIKHVKSVRMHGAINENNLGYYLREQLAGAVLREEWLRGKLENQLAHVTQGNLESLHSMSQSRLLQHIQALTPKKSVPIPH